MKTSNAIANAKTENITGNKTVSLYRCNRVKNGGVNMERELTKKEQELMSEYKLKGEPLWGFGQIDSFEEIYEELDSLFDLTDNEEVILEFDCALNPQDGTYSYFAWRADVEDVDPKKIKFNTRKQKKD